MAGVPEPIALASTYSLMRGVLSTDQLCRLAVESKSTFIGIPDRLGFFGLPTLIERARYWKLRTCVGVDLSDPADPDMLFLAYCRDTRGYRVLNRLLTEFSQEKNWPLKDVVRFLGKQNRGELAVVCRPHEALRPLYQQEKSEQMPLYFAALWGREYAFLQPLARTLGIPLIALNRGLWRDKEERERYLLLRAIDSNMRVQDLPDWEHPPEWTRLPGPQELDRFFAPVPELIAAQRHFIRDWEAVDILPRSWVFPLFREQSEEQSFQELARLCEDGLAKRYAGASQEILSAAQLRLQKELEIILKKGFAAYFLVVHDIVRQVPRTCGRGSAASSIVSFLLEITHVDPLAYDLFFERFLNIGRMDPPDIDVDFPWDEREAALAYVFETYPGRAAMVADHVTFARRSALREAAKALGYSKEETDALLEYWVSGRKDELPPTLRRHAEGIKGQIRFLGTHPGGVVITPGPMSDYAHTRISPLGWPVLPWEKDGTEDAGLVKIDILGNRSLGVLRDTLAMVQPLRAAQKQPKLEWASFNPIHDAGARKLIEEGQTLGVFYVESPATRQLLSKMRSGSFEHLVIASSIIRPAANRWINLFVERLHGATWESLDARVDSILSETFGIMVYQEDVARIAIGIAGFSPEEGDGLRKVLTRKDRELRLGVFRDRFVQGARERGTSERTIQQLWEMILSFDGYSFCKSHSASYALVSYKLSYLRRLYPLQFFTAVLQNAGGFYRAQTYVNQVRRLGFPIFGPDVNSPTPNFAVRRRGLGIGLGSIKGLSLATIAAIIQAQKRFPFLGLDDFLSRVPASEPELRSLIRCGAFDSMERGMNRPQMLWRLVSFRSALPSRRRQGLSYATRASLPIEHSAVLVQPAQGEHTEGQELAGKISKIVNRQQAIIQAPGILYERSQPLELFEQQATPIPISDYSTAVKLYDELATMDLAVSRHPLSAFFPRLRKFAAEEGLAPLLSTTRLANFVDRRVFVAGTFVTGKEVWTAKKKSMAFFTFEDQFDFLECVAFPDSYTECLHAIAVGTAFLVEGIVLLDHGVLSLQIRKIYPFSADY